MPKRRLTLKVRIPEYKAPRNVWRQGIHKAVMEQKERAEVKYLPEDKLEVIVKMYLRGTKLKMSDIDNRLKDILDSLQGHAGGSKKIRALKPIIPNDSQIYRVIIEKMDPPKQSHGLGHLVVRKYKGKKE